MKNILCTHQWSEWVELDELHNDNTVWQRSCNTCRAKDITVSKLKPQINMNLLIKNMPIQRSSWNTLVDYLSKNDKEEAIEALSILTEKQAKGIIAFIAEWETLNELVALKTVLHDLAGIAQSNDMFIPKTHKYQPQD